MINKIELPTKTLAKELGFICKSYKNDYSCFSNDHQVLADKIIALMTQFEEYSTTIVNEKEKEKKALMDFFILVVLINDINAYLKSKESTKFKAKFEGLIERFKLSYLLNNSSEYGHFKWRFQGSDQSRGIIWAYGRHFQDDNLFKCIEDDINFKINAINNVGHGGKTIVSLYKTQLDEWLEQLTESDKIELKTKFVDEHCRLLTEAKDSFGGCLRGTKVDYSQSVADFIKHAQTSNNRSRQAFINIGVMDLEGRLTQQGQEALKTLGI